MKKIILGSLVVLALLVGAVLVAPGFVDWNAYKGEIAARLGAMTDRAVVLGGDLRLSLLPHPALTVTDARLASLPGAAEPDMVRLKRLDVKVALLPLLGGRVQVESVTLVEPTIVFEVLADGRFNWDLGGDAAAPRPSVGGDGLTTAVSFDRVAIENGTVLYRDAQSGRHERIEAVDARVVAGSLAGPFQVEGRFTLRGVPMSGELTAGRFAEGAAVPLRVSVALPDTDATVRFAGIVDTGKPGTPQGARAQGDLRAEGSDAGRVVAALNGAAQPPSPVLKQPFALRSAVEASAGALSFGSLELQLGDTRATGSATVRPQQPAHLELALAVNRLDLDAWQRLADDAPPPPPPAGNRAAVSAGGDAGPAFALPEGVTARVDLAADGVTYNGGVVRQARLEASLAGGLLAIDRLSALLPGGSDVVAAGSLAVANGQPAIDLRMEANADNLRGLLDWLRLDVAAVPQDRLRKASLAVHVEGRPDKIDVNGLDLRLDTSRITGAVAYVDRGRPAFGVRLDVDRLNLDAYRQPPAPGAASAGGAGGVVPQPALERLLHDVDANVELSVGNLTAGGVAADGVTLAASSTGGKLEIRKAAVANLAGVAAEVTGQVDNVLPLRGLRLAVSARADSLSGLTRLVPWPAGAPTPEQLGAVSVQGRFAGDLETLAVEVAADAAGGRLEVGGTVAAPATAPNGALKVRATHPEMAGLVRLVSDGAPAALGALDLYAELTGTPRAFAVKDLQGIVAGTAVKGAASVDAKGPRPRVEADLQTGALDLTRLAAGPGSAASTTAAARPPATGGQSAGASSPVRSQDGFAWLRAVDGRLGLTAAAVTADTVRLDNVALATTLEDGVLTLQQLDGGLFQGQLGATGRFAVPDGAVPSGSLDVTVVKAKLDHAVSGGAIGLGAGTVDLDLSLETQGTDGDAMVRALDGSARLAVRDGVLRGFDLGALRDRLTARLDRPQDVLEAVLRGLQGGDTPFASLDGTFAIADGVARTDDVRLVSAIGDAGAAGQVDLAAGTLDMRVRVDPHAVQELPPVTVRLTGPLDQPSRSFEMAELQDFIARRAAGAVLERALPGSGGSGSGSAAPQPQDVIRGLIEGLR